MIRLHTMTRSIILQRKYRIRDLNWREYIMQKTLSLAYVILGILSGVIPKVHTNACGDFTMMARKCWEKLHGHPEIPIYSLHIDSILCYMAIAMGLRQVILKKPLQIFHIEHENSWVTLSPEKKLSFFVEKPWIPLEVLKGIRRHMFKNKKPLDLNDEDWGLASMDLQEHIFIS